MFTDRFIKLPIKIADKETAEYIKDEDWEDSYEMINPFEIASYRPSRKYEGRSTCLFLKNGEDYLINLSIKDFEDLLNKHQSS